MEIPKNLKKREINRSKKKDRQIKKMNTEYASSFFITLLTS